MQVNATLRRERVAGSVYGAAIGDALGAPTEFLSLDRIRAEWPPAGPLSPFGSSAAAGSLIRVTDDTQMSLAVGEALLEAWQGGAGLSPKACEHALRRHFVRWVYGGENDRAPGRTCVAACTRLERGGPWQATTALESKGCGANMRVAPVAWLPRSAVDDCVERYAQLSQFQSALTHAHPTAIAASDLTAFAIRRRIESSEFDPCSFRMELVEYAESQRSVYHDAWLGELWKQAGSPAPTDFIARGWDECLAALARLEVALATGDPDGDPCAITGGGWIAEEALATALYCVLAHPHDPLRAVQHAAASSGDSDTIACIAGAIAGAGHGASAWPDEWIARLEYRARLETLVEAFGGDRCPAVTRSPVIAVRVATPWEDASDVLMVFVGPDREQHPWLAKSAAEIPPALEPQLRLELPAQLTEGAVYLTEPGPLAARQVVHAVGLDRQGGTQRYLLQHVLQMTLERVDLPADGQISIALAGASPGLIEHLPAALLQVLDLAARDSLRVVLLASDEGMAAELQSRLGSGA